MGMRVRLRLGLLLVLLWRRSLLLLRVGARLRLLLGVRLWLLGVRVGLLGLSLGLLLCLGVLLLVCLCLCLRLRLRLRLGLRLGLLLCLGLVLCLRLLLVLLCLCLGLLLLVLGLVLRGLLLRGLVLGRSGIERLPVGVKDEVPDVHGLGVDGLFADLAGLAVDPDDAAVVVDRVEDVCAAGPAAARLGPGDQYRGRCAVPCLAELVGYSGVAVLGVLAGRTEVGARVLLDVGGAVPFAGPAVDAAAAVGVVGAWRGDLRVAVPGLHEGAGAIGAVVAASGDVPAAVVLELRPGLERVVERARSAVRVPREARLQRLLVAWERRIQAARLDVEADPYVGVATAVRGLRDRCLRLGLLVRQGWDWSGF